MITKTLFPISYVFFSTISWIFHDILIFSFFQEFSKSETLFFHFQVFPGFLGCMGTLTEKLMPQQI